MPTQVAEAKFFLYRPVQMYEPSTEEQKDGFLLMRHKLEDAIILGSDVWALQGEMTLKEFAQKHVQ